MRCSFLSKKWTEMRSWIHYALLSGTAASNLDVGEILTGVIMRIAEKSVPADRRGFLPGGVPSEVARERRGVNCASSLGGGIAGVGGQRRRQPRSAEPPRQGHRPLARSQAQLPVRARTHRQRRCTHLPIFMQPAQLQDFRLSYCPVCNQG